MILTMEHENRMVPECGERHVLWTVNRTQFEVLSPTLKIMGHYLLLGQLLPHHILCPKVSFMAQSWPSLPLSHLAFPIWLTCSNELS